jgi:hypothetical protein
MPTIKNSHFIIITINLDFIPKIKNKKDISFLPILNSAMYLKYELYYLYLLQLHCSKYFFGVSLFSFELKIKNFLDFSSFTLFFFLIINYKQKL